MDLLRLPYSNPDRIPLLIERGKTVHLTSNNSKLRYVSFMLLKQKKLSFYFPFTYTHFIIFYQPLLSYKNPTLTILYCCPNWDNQIRELNIMPYKISMNNHYQLCITKSFCLKSLLPLSSKFISDGIFKGRLAPLTALSKCI